MTDTPPRVRLISTGSEITQGMYADSNAQRLSVILFDKGFRVVGHAAAPDDFDTILAAIEDAAPRADLVIMTGGLGPTEDDLNRDVISRWCNQPLVENREAEAMIRERFRKRGREMPPDNARQAFIPREATILLNHWGTAPGFLVPAAEHRPALLALPGPSSEWMPMLAESLGGPLHAAFPHRPRRSIYSMHLAMVPESTINGRIRDLFANQPGCELTILASRGHIRLRIAATGPRDDENQANTRRLRDLLATRLGEPFLFAEGPGDQTLAAALVALFRQHQKTLATAESCTGGWIAKELTDVAGSSQVIKSGWVTYSNDAKIRDLTVSPAILGAHGAVSEPVVRAMAEGARAKSGADYAVAVSGIAGPDGGSYDKPVGTVWFAVASPSGTFAARRLLGGDRESVRSFATIQALEFLRRALLNIDPQATIT
ncbi:CinA family nicotinamide mononucleotide deamidase-related protein [Candidatus Sumerlaeota bacterium]|nr:CinA family nicotinamide mononucleotide deamidase-related protein [Candidatus Sumerlaeota bacterium]